MSAEQEIRHHINRDGEESYVPRESGTSQRGSRKRKRGGKFASQRRQDDYRRAKNREAEADPNFPVGRKAMDRKYGSLADEGIDFQSCEPAITPVRTSAILPISTRGVGMAVGASYYEATRYGADKIARLCTIHQAYRAALVQFTMRLSKQEDGRVWQFPVNVTRADVFLSPEILSLVEGYRTTFSLVANTLSAVGWFEHANGAYQTGLVPDVSLRLRANSSFELNALNLRSVLEMVAEGAAHSDEFIATNAIPGANYLNGRLTNLDEVVPAGWPSRQLVKGDLDAYSSLCVFLKTKKSNFVSSIDYSARALPTALGFRTCRRADAGRIDTDAVGFHCTIPFRTSWYSVSRLDPGLWVRSVLSLISEKYRDTDTQRNPEVAVEEIAADWASLASTALRR